MSLLQAGDVLKVKLTESLESDSPQVVAMMLIFHSLLPKSYQFYGISGNYEVGGPILRFVDSPKYLCPQV